MMVLGVRGVSGVLPLAISATVLILAVGNLLSQPLVERQLVAAVPSAEASAADTAAQPRRKSYHGVAAGTAIGLAGAALFLGEMEPGSGRVELEPVPIFLRLTTLEWTRGLMASG